MQKMSSNVIIDDKVPSTLGNKNKIINIIIERIKKYPVATKIDYDELFLIIDEALTNAMEHGNHWDPYKFVDIKINRLNQFISIAIEDEGSGFDTGLYTKSDSFPNHDYRGRGIRIIRHFCNPVWNAAGNKINFYIETE